MEEGSPEIGIKKTMKAGKNVLFAAADVTKRTFLQHGSNREKPRLFPIIMSSDEKHRSIQKGDGKKEGIMKNRYAKALTMMTALGLLAASLPGCGSSTSEGTSGSTDSTAGSSTSSTVSAAEAETTAASDGEVTVVNMAIPSFYDFSDSPQVEAALNEILGEKYGINVKLTYISVGAWQQQTNLLLTGSDCDVLAGFITPLTTYVNNGQILALDDYLADDEAMQAVFSEAQLKGTQINGKQYALSNFKDFAGAVDYWMDEDIVNELGIDISSIKTLDDIGAVLEQVHAAHPELYAIAPQHDSQMLSSRWTWDDLGVGFASAFTSIANDGQDTTVTCTYDNEDFLDFVHHTYEWYQAGYVMPDTLSNTEAGDSLILGGKAFSTFANGSINALADGIVSARIIEPWCNSSAYAGVTYCINANSAHPDEAWKLLEAVYTDSDVATLLECGIEGTHYVLNDDGTISYPEGVDSSSSTYGGAQQAWIFPNASIAPVLSTTGGPDYYSEMADFNNSAENSKAVGFMFDTSTVTDAYSACLNIHQKYFNALLCGAVNPDEIIPQAESEMKEAGLDSVIEEEQSQLDAFLAQ